MPGALPAELYHDPTPDLEVVKEIENLIVAIWTAPAPPAVLKAGKGQGQLVVPTGMASRQCLFLHEKFPFALFGSVKGYGVFAKSWSSYYDQPSARPDHPPEPEIEREKGPGMIGSASGIPEPGMIPAGSRFIPSRKTVAKQNV